MVCFGHGGCGAALIRATVDEDDGNIHSPWVQDLIRHDATESETLRCCFTSNRRKASGHVRLRIPPTDASVRSSYAAFGTLIKIGARRSGVGGADCRRPIAAGLHCSRLEMHGLEYLHR